MNNYQRFDVPPFMPHRMFCAANAIIDVLNLPINKITNGDVGELVRVLRKITQRDPGNDYGTLSLIIQNIIDTKSGNEETADKIMELTAQKLEHLTLTNQFL